MKAYISMHIVKKVKTSSGKTVDFGTGGVLGIFVAFKTKKLAMAKFGKDVKLLEINNG